MENIKQQYEKNHQRSKRAKTKIQSAPKRAGENKNSGVVIEEPVIERGPLKEQ